DFRPDFRSLKSSEQKHELACFSFRRGCPDSFINEHGRTSKATGSVSGWSFLSRYASVAGRIFRQRQQKPTVSSSGFSSELFPGQPPGLHVSIRQRPRVVRDSWQSSATWLSTHLFQRGQGFRN